MGGSSLLQPIPLGYVPSQGYSFPYGGLQGHGLPLGHSVPPVHGMPQMGHGASHLYNVASSITPVQVGKGKSSHRPSVPVHSPIIPISSTAGGASSSTAPQVSVGCATSGFGFVTPSRRRSRSFLSLGLSRIKRSKILRIRTQICR